MSDEKRLFVGAEVQAPWPIDLPQSGRLLDPWHRHMTLAFLGKQSVNPILEILKEFPSDQLKVGIAGQFTKVLFFPSEKNRRVICWDVELFEKEKRFCAFRDRLCKVLSFHKIEVDAKKFHPHVTMARGHFDPEEWKNCFKPLPMVISSIHLYESLGNSHYQSLWEYPMKPPFEEIKHTTDNAFLIRGNTPDEVHLHAQIALCFPFPQILPYIEVGSLNSDLDDIVIHLNELVTKVDQEIGCPFKAVSFHGEVKQNGEGIFEWEMIIDV